jgi:serine-type D-Ala-D-Ala carboxypeptidase (penicillin-binding protein 5/6)
MKYLNFLLISFVLLTLQNKAFSEIDVTANYVIVEDHLSGEILFEKDADTKIYPASMTKIMTSIVVFDLLKSGETTLDEKIIISERAWRMSQSGYSSMFIMLGDQISVENLLKGIIIVSGNDACVALAEGLAGTEENFALLMNEKAADIGMENSNFSNASGINDPSNYSTVRDILKMSSYLIKNYPEYYTYFEEKTFTWDRTGGDPITQPNRNPLLYKNMGVDGIKTGFLTVEKYSLASSIKSGQRRITVVGSGFDSKNLRSRESIKLLSWALRNYDTVQVGRKDEDLLSLKVWMGKKPKVNVSVKEDLFFTIPKRKRSTVKAIIEYKQPILAPVKKGDEIGKLKIYIAGDLKKEIEVLANEDIKRTNIFNRVFRSLNYFVWGDV